MWGKIRKQRRIARRMTIVALSGCLASVLSGIGIVVADQDEREYRLCWSESMSEFEKAIFEDEGRADDLGRTLKEKATGLFGTNSVEYAHICARWADVRSWAGHHREAKGLGLEAARVLRGASGKEPELIEVLTHLGAECVALGELTEGVQHYGEALAVSEREFGDYDPRCATLYVNIAGVAREGKDYERAELFLLKAVMAYGISGRETPGVIVPLTSLGLLLRERGREMGARRTLSVAVGVAERTLGPQDGHTQHLRALLEQQGESGAPIRRGAEDWIGPSDERR